MRLVLSFSEEIQKKRWPLSPQQSKKLVEGFAREMKPHFAWTEAQKILGPIKSVGLHLCSDSQMRDYSRQYKGLDRSTDVLSFPSIELDLKEHEFSGHLGDLIVCADYMERAIKRLRRKSVDHYKEIVLHGCLHLLGLEHVRARGASAAEAREMQKIQAILCRKIQL